MNTLRTKTPLFFLKSDGSWVVLSSSSQPHPVLPVWQFISWPLLPASPVSFAAGIAELTDGFWTHVQMQTPIHTCVHSLPAPGEAKNVLLAWQNYFWGLVWFHFPAWNWTFPTERNLWKVFKVVRILYFSRRRTCTFATGGMQCDRLRIRVALLLRSPVISSCVTQEGGDRTWDQWVCQTALKINLILGVWEEIQIPLALTRIM